jgi:hypothetical protein
MCQPVAGRTKAPKVPKATKANKAAKDPKAQKAPQVPKAEGASLKKGGKVAVTRGAAEVAIAPSPAAEPAPATVQEAEPLTTCKISLKSCASYDCEQRHVNMLFIYGVCIFCQGVCLFGSLDGEVTRPYHSCIHIAIAEKEEGGISRFKDDHVSVRLN